MNEQNVTRITIVQRRSPLSYSEQETTASSHISVRVLHHLHALGLIEGEEIGGELRYSEEEIIQLRRIRRLQYDLGINLAGVEVIVHLLKRVEALQSDLEQERNRRLQREGKSDEH